VIVVGDSIASQMMNMIPLKEDWVKLTYPGLSTVDIYKKFKKEIQSIKCFPREQSIIVLSCGHNGMLTGTDVHNLLKTTGKLATRVIVLLLSKRRNTHKDVQWRNEILAAEVQKVNKDSKFELLDTAKLAGGADGIVGPEKMKDGSHFRPEQSRVLAKTIVKRVLNMRL